MSFKLSIPGNFDRLIRSSSGWKPKKIAVLARGVTTKTLITGQLVVPLPGDDELIVRSGRPHIAAGLGAKDSLRWNRVIGHYIEVVDGRHGRARWSNRPEDS